MKKVTRTLALLLTLCTLLSCLSIFVSADSLISNETISETIPHNHDEIIDPCAFVGYCIQPGCKGEVLTGCKDENLYWGKTTHNTLFSGECTVLYYASGLLEYCNSCNVIFDEIEARVCYELHSSCIAAPIYNVCTGTGGHDLFD